MTTIRYALAVSLGCIFALSSEAQPDFQLPENVHATKQPTLVSDGSTLPPGGTFWLAYGEDGHPMPPFPYLPCPGGVYDIGGGQFVVDNEATATTAQLTTMNALVSGPPNPGGGDGGGGGTPPAPPVGRMAVKFKNVVPRRFQWNAGTSGRPWKARVWALRPGNTGF